MTRPTLTPLGKPVRIHEDVAWETIPAEAPSPIAVPEAAPEPVPA